MCHDNFHVHSLEVATTAEDSLLIYCKPVELYNILHLRSLNNVIWCIFYDQITSYSIFYWFLADQLPYASLCTKFPLSYSHWIEAFRSKIFTCFKLWSPLVAIMYLKVHSFKNKHLCTQQRWLCSDEINSSVAAFFSSTLFALQVTS